MCFKLNSHSVYCQGNNCITSKTLTQQNRSILSGLGINIVSIFYERAKEAEFTKLIQVLDLGDNKVDVEYHLLLNGTADSSHGKSLEMKHFLEV